MKNFFTYHVFLVIFLSIVGSMFFGALLRHHYLGGGRAESLQKIAVFFASVPSRARDMVKYKNINRRPVVSDKHKKKKTFEKFIKNKRNAILILPRYNYSLMRSITEIIDLNNFEVLHVYRHDISSMLEQIKNTKEFPDLKLLFSPKRFIYHNPIILENGSLISTSGILYKIDFCSNLQWINDEEYFHHSLMLDHEGNVWTGGRMNPKSKYVKKYSIEDFFDDSIIKTNTDGQILFNKSVTEILIENKIVPKNFALNSFLSKVHDPIHLNDIEPALSDSEHWKQGDVFLSIRDQNAIVHYRPRTNKIINYITGPFVMQHDVDIISDKEISIFNNNNFVANNEYSEVIIYNFETKKFKKLFNEQLQKNNFKTELQGLSHIFNDGALMVEEHNHGRLILFNNQGIKEWEFINKDQNGYIGEFQWTRVMEDEKFIKNFKLMVKNKQCLN